MYDRNNIHFWEHHGNNHNDYISLAKKSEILYVKWLDGLNINDMLYDNGCYEIASAYFSENQLIRVSRYPEGFYKLEGDGRHRVVVAQELDIYIPVKIIGEYRWFGRILLVVTGLRIFVHV